jgi:hypothetical protein
MHTKFWSENLKGRDHSKDLGHRWEDNIKMAQDRDQQQAFVNTIMNLQQ